MLRISLFKRLVGAAVVLLLGAFISEGFVSEKRAGFNNLDRDYFATVVAAYDAVVGGQRYLSSRQIASGSMLHELDVQNLTALRRSRLSELADQRSAHKVVPEWLWQSPAPVKRAFLQALFEGDGSCSLLPRNTVQVSYSTFSERLASDVQQMLLEFGAQGRHHQSRAGRDIRGTSRFRRFKASQAHQDPGGTFHVCRTR